MISDSTRALLEEHIGKFRSYNDLPFQQPYRNRPTIYTTILNACDQFFPLHSWIDFTERSIDYSTRSMIDLLDSTPDASGYPTHAIATLDGFRVSIESLHRTSSTGLIGFLVFYPEPLGQRVIVDLDETAGNHMAASLISRETFALYSLNSALGTMNGEDDPLDFLDFHYQQRTLHLATDICEWFNSAHRQLADLNYSDELHLTMKRLKDDEEETDMDLRDQTHGNAQDLCQCLDALRSVGAFPNQDRRRARIIEKQAWR